MLMGFISFLLTVGQKPISKICIGKGIAYSMLPCKKENSTATRSDHCSEQVDIKLYHSHCVHSVFEFLDAIRGYLDSVSPIDIYVGWAYLIILLSPLDSRVSFLLSP